MRYSTRNHHLQAVIEYTGSDAASGHPVEHRVEAGGEEDGYPLVKGYLEIEEGKEFRVTLKRLGDKRQWKGLRVDASVDGRALGARVCLDSAGTWSMDEMHVQTEVGSCAGNLRFVALAKTSEEDEVTVRGEAVNAIGSIIITVEKGQWTPQGADRIIQAVPQLGTIHEKQLKLGSGVSCGDLRPATKKNNYGWHADKLDPQICRFVFKYSTRDLLIIKGIIDDDVPPQAPAPSDPAPEVGDTDHDDPDRTLVEEPAVKTESKPDIKPSTADPAHSTSNKKRPRTRTDKAVLPAHGSADRPFRIDNEDSDDEVTLDHHSVWKKQKVEVDYTEFD